MTTAEELAGVPVFAPLAEAQRTAVAEAARAWPLADGEVLFREGEPATGCWVIRSGSVALSTPVPGRGQVVVQTLHPPDVVGWSWLVPPHRWAFTATAAGPTSTLRFDAARLRALTAEDPALCCSLLSGLCGGLLDRLQDTRARLLDVYGNPRDR
jgi:CRP-like cAMP-binding protein